MMFRKKWFVGQLLCCFAAALLLCMLSGCAQKPAKEELTPKGVYSDVIGHFRIQLYSDTLIRIEQERNGSAYEDRTTFAVVDREGWPGVEKLTRSETDEAVTLQTDRFILTVPKETVTPKDITLTDLEGNSLWSYEYSLTSNMALPDPADTGTSWCFSDSPRLVPAAQPFLSQKDSADSGAGALNGWENVSSINDLYVFLPNGDAKTLRADFNKLTGPTDLLPLKAFGLWYSRYYAYTDKELLQVIDDFRAHGYPLDYLVVDTDWRVGASTGYEINTALFPDMKEFLSLVHKKNVFVSFNDHVRASNESMLSENQLDWFNKNLREIMDLGLDTWWFDRNWSNALISPVSGIHPDLMGQAMYTWICQNQKPNTRTFVMSNLYWIRSGLVESTMPNIAAHRYGVQWTGDIACTSDALKTEIIDYVLASAISGTPYLSSDLGGHMGMPSEALYCRWSQFGAFAPIMRYHSNHTTRIPWEVGSEANQVAKNYVQMRYHLLPLFYSLAHENYETGMPLVRSLTFNYPKYEESKDQTQYLLGDDLLVAPIWEADAESVVVPAGWLTDDTGKNGLTGRYYNDQNLSGTPVFTRTDQEINFDWGMSAIDSRLAADHVSIRWTGSLTVPAGKEVFLNARSDDGVRVYLDGKLIIDNWADSDSVLTWAKTSVKAGKHKLQIDYYEGENNAKIILGYSEKDPFHPVNSRSVFLPDGSWMDVWNGSIINGAKTITATHGITTSPLFLRVGSLFVLDDAGESASTADWDAVTIDLYPAELASGSFAFYEDDGSSDGYQKADNRTTDIKAAMKKGVLSLSVGKAKGSYQTKWTQRKWTVRVHLTGAKKKFSQLTVNGQKGSLALLAQDKTAQPFAVTGGSPDGDVQTFTFTLPVNQSAEISLS